MNELTEHLRSGAHLDDSQVDQATNTLLDVSVTAEQKANFLTALADKGETPSEIAAFVNAFLEHAEDPGLDASQIDAPLIDVCGTGGDKLDLFNVSTTAVFVLAACGVCVVKHGNRGITSKSGGADVLEHLGIRIDLPPEQFVECVKRVGAGFLFAQNYHPAFKAVGPVRKLLAQQGQRTVFNILGPLLNPVRPDYQLIGVFDPALPPVFADILGRLGRKRAWAVHGSAGDFGMDEISTLGPTRVSEFFEGEVREQELTPTDFGIDEEAVSLDDLRGGDAAVNADILTGILSGEVKGAKRGIVVANAASALVVAGKAKDVIEGMLKAADAIDSGRAAGVLKKWQAFGG